MSVTDLPPGTHAAPEPITNEELALAARNHGMPLEGLRYDITPIGMHYLLIHFDIPAADERTWTVEVGGMVEQPLTLSVEELRSRPAVTMPVTMECAGNGRARLDPRPLSQPWLDEAIGTATWTGTPLAPILEEAGVRPDAVELVFRGADHGTQCDIEQDYERSLSIADASRHEVILAYEINGQPLPPQHGFPVRLVVPGWYGMTSVKWLRSITAVAEPFDGFQMWAYKLRQREEDDGTPVTRMMPRALMVPPGFPDFFTRSRIVDAGTTTVEGRAWSGWGVVTRVEFSVDGGASWSDADLFPPVGPHAWRGWSHTWAAEAGDHDLMVRASDEAGNVQPLEQPWNEHGFSNNLVQRVAVLVR
jgi:DMSO/TMAO reductase YedYZ molybdopterin-dependent catalytic subunit